MEAVVLTNDYLPRQGVDISPTFKSLHCDKRHSKDPLNFLNFENYRESTSEQWDGQYPPLAQSLAWCDEEETVGVCIINASN